ncbi:MAG: SpaH/EbpB family LPXTG-anchored major pilin [Ruminococcus sp.]|nr:SpaH/EbpB family LPXTG-anchored major pilin [Ruminococcus sp.]
MKTTKKALAVFTVLMLLVMTIFSAMPASASAKLDTSATVGFTLTCDKPGYEFTIYKVADLVNTTTDPYETRYDSLVPEIKDSVLSGNTESILSALDAVKTMPNTATVVGTYESSAEASVTYDNLSQGIYYVRTTNYPANVKSVTNSVFALPYYDGTDWKYSISDIKLAMKITDNTPTTVKTITNSTKGNVNFTDVSLGDVVDFEIRSTTAGSSSLKLTTYTVYDNMSAGLTLDEDSFNVALLKADGTKIADVDSSYYTVTVTSEGEGKNTEFNVALTPGYLQKEDFYASDVYYTSVTYSATLNDASTTAFTGNPNEEIKLVYANANGVAAEIEGNTVYVYTYAIQAVKVDEDMNPLANAQFAIYLTKADATAQQNAVATGTSDASGLVNFKTANGDDIRLASGTYYIVETVAPEGYNRYTEAIEVKVTAEYANTFTEGTWISSAPENGVAIVTVSDSKVILPQTGGQGMMVVYIIAGAFAVLAVAVFVFGKKRKATSAQ